MTNKKLPLSSLPKCLFGMVEVPFRHGQRGTSRQPKFPFDLAKVPPLRCSLVPRDAVSMLYFLY